MIYQKSDWHANGFVRKIVLLFLLMFSGMVLNVRGEGQDVECRASMSLDGVWKFCPAFVELQYNHAFLQKDLPNQKKYDRGAVDRYYGWIEPEFDDDVWWDISVPGSWNTQFEDLWSYEGHGWYRRKMHIPKVWEGKRVVFHSDGANYRTVLYVNGNKAGVHEGGYTAFQFPIHSYLQFGEENTFAIAVDNESLADRCPTERHDWWDHGGLYRSVRLEATEPVYVKDAVVVTDALNSPAVVEVDAEVGIETDTAGPLKLVALLFDPAGRNVAQTSSDVSVQDQNGKSRLRLEVADALQWTPDTPHLYQLVLELQAEGNRLDRWERRIGIRTLQIDGTRFLLNGKPFLIKGLNRYENYADTGMTPNDAAMRQDVQLIKDMGGNAIRCHYPHSPTAYDFYDEAGLFMVCEVPLYQWGRPGHSTKNLDAAKFQLEEMIRTLRNHPSVLMWSVSNETRTRPREEGEEHRKLSEMVVNGNKELVDIAHELDPTRPAIEASNRWPDDPVFEKTDIHAVNVYFGARTPHVDSLGSLRDAMHSKMEKLREMHPGKPILASEFGSWALWGFKADYFPGENYQAGLIRNYWEGLLEEEGFIGGFIWCFADSDVHRKYSTIYEMRCAYGIFDIYRRPKEAVRVMTEIWKNSE